MDRTIIAASTPLGGALALIRMSGPLSLDILIRLSGRKNFKPRYAHCVVVDTGTIKDKCIAVYYPKESSFTGEECVELSCHGSKVIVSEVIKFAIDHGAVSAERGEFTRTAYENKKLDLTEAEGILELINSETVEQAANAFLGAEGELSRKIEDIQSELKRLIAALEVAIDYPEEDIEETTIDGAKREISALMKEVKALMGSFNDSRKLFGGVKVVFTGKVNVGKSSLFNALLGYKRAIVSEKAGTTRDFIESDYIYKGRKFVLVDTAGIRTTRGEIEREGIDLALQELNGSDLVVGVGVGACEFEGKADLVVTNKCDIACGAHLNVSALTGEGIENLKEEIYRRTDFEPKGIKVNLRQYEALKVAYEALERAHENTLSVDCMSADLFDAYNGLGKVTGVIGSDEIIAEIFSAFCVGK